MFSIRRATKDDFDPIFLLLKQLWPDKEMNEEDCLLVFKKGILSDHYLCLEVNHTIIAFCSITIKNSFWEAGSIAYISELIVNQSYRGQGVGKLLLKKAEQAACQLHCKRIELDSGFQREQAHLFYEQIGYAKRGFVFSKVLS